MPNTLLRQLMDGTLEEMEHTDDRREAVRIALDHLTENKDYYNKLKGAGLMDTKDMSEMAVFKAGLARVARCLQGVAKAALPEGTVRARKDGNYKKVSGEWVKLPPEGGGKREQKKKLDEAYAKAGGKPAAGGGKVTPAAAMLLAGESKRPDKREYLLSYGSLNKRTKSLVDSLISSGHMRLDEEGQVHVTDSGRAVGSKSKTRDELGLDDEGKRGSEKYARSRPVKPAAGGRSALHPALDKVRVNPDNPDEPDYDDLINAAEAMGVEVTEDNLDRLSDKWQSAKVKQPKGTSGLGLTDQQSMKISRAHKAGDAKAYAEALEAAAPGKARELQTKIEADDRLGKFKGI